MGLFDETARDLNRLSDKVEARRREQRKLSLRGATPKRWSHQDELAAAKGQRIVIRLVDGTYTSGELLEADQFTIKIGFSSGDPSVLFKAHILSFIIER